MGIGYSLPPAIISVIARSPAPARLAQFRGGSVSRTDRLFLSFRNVSKCDTGRPIDIPRTGNLSNAIGLISLYFPFGKLST